MATRIISLRLKDRSRFVLEIELCQPEGIGVQERVKKSLNVSASRIASQKKPATTTILVSPGLYLTCMKNRTTSVAFVTAMASAATVFIAPKSTKAIAVVSAVRARRVKKTRK